MRRALTNAISAVCFFMAGVFIALSGFHQTDENVKWVGWLLIIVGWIFVFISENTRFDKPKKGGRGEKQ